MFEKSFSTFPSLFEYKKLCVYKRNSVEKVSLHMKRTIKTTFNRELRETIVVRSSRQLRLFCVDCRAESSFLSLDAAVQVSGIATREILRRLGTHEVRVRELTDGLMVVCLKSLVKRE